MKIGIIQTEGIWEPHRGRAAEGTRAAEERGPGAVGHRGKAALWREGPLPVRHSGSS